MRQRKALLNSQNSPAPIAPRPLLSFTNKPWRPRDVLGVSETKIKKDFTVFIVWKLEYLCLLTREKLRQRKFLANQISKLLSTILATLGTNADLKVSETEIEKVTQKFLTFSKLVSFYLEKSPSLRFRWQMAITLRNPIWPQRICIWGFLSNLIWVQVNIWCSEIKGIKKFQLRRNHKQVLFSQLTLLVLFVYAQQAEIAYSNQNNSATVSKLTFQAASTGKPMNCRSWLSWCWVACHSFDLSPKTSDNYALSKL